MLERLRRRLVAWLVDPRLAEEATRNRNQIIVMAKVFDQHLEGIRRDLAASDQREIETTRRIEAAFEVLNLYSWAEPKTLGKAFQLWKKKRAKAHADEVAKLSAEIAAQEPPAPAEAVTEAVGS